MNKSSGQQASAKAALAKDKLADKDFDRLVLDTSHRVGQRVGALAEPKRAQDGGSGEHAHCPASRSPSASTSASASASSSPLSSSSCSSSAVVCAEAAEAAEATAAVGPGQPKRPMNAFMVWGQAIRRELHQRFSNVQNASLSKALGRVWRSLDAQQKEPYVRRANLIKAKHKRDYPNYRYQPRRVHERRARSSMLIGIELDHPVNQHQARQASNQLAFGRQDHQLHHHHHHQLQHQLPFVQAVERPALFADDAKLGQLPFTNSADQLQHLEAKDYVRAQVDGCQANHMNQFVHHQHQHHHHPQLQHQQHLQQHNHHQHPQQQQHQQHQQHQQQLQSAKQPVEFTYPPYQHHHLHTYGAQTDSDASQALVYHSRDEQSTSYERQQSQPFACADQTELYYTTVSPPAEQQPTQVHARPPLSLFGQDCTTDAQLTAFSGAQRIA